MGDDDGLVRVGRVVKPHGIRGELVVDPSGETLAALNVGDAILVGGEPQKVTGVRPHQGRTLLRLDSCAGRNRAEELRGAFVEVPFSTLQAAGEAEWYGDDLVGWSVLTTDGAAIGDVLGLVPGPVHDYLDLGPSRLVPMVRDWLVRVDADQRELYLDLPPGLLTVESADEV